MLTLTIRQLEEKLPIWIETRLSVYLIGPPGTGKTFNARKIATAMGRPVEVLDGGQENEWKALFPYRTPTGEIRIGRALMADGGTLIVDEGNRTPPEMKTSFQLLASEKVVPWPEGGVKSVDVAIVATANDSDLGVEESARAELDRYDLIVRLIPTPEEIGEIVSRQAKVSAEAAALMYEAVAELASKLDARKFYKPEGIRMAISIARVLRSGTLGPADAFKGSAERSWPLGRPGAEKYRPEFDQVVSEVSNKFAGKMANLGTLTSRAASSASSTAPATPSVVGSLQDLQVTLTGSLQETVTSPPVALPTPFSHLMHAFTQSFGAGVALHLMKNAKPGSTAERRGVKLHFGATGAADSIEFRGVERHKVEQFLRLILEA